MPRPIPAKQSRFQPWFIPLIVLLPFWYAFWIGVAGSIFFVYIELIRMLF